MSRAFNTMRLIHGLSEDELINLIHGWQDKYHSAQIRIDELETRYGHHFVTDSENTRFCAICGEYMTSDIHERA